MKEKGHKGLMFRDGWMDERVSNIYGNWVIEYTF